MVVIVRGLGAACARRFETSVHRGQLWDARRGRWVPPIETRKPEPQPKQETYVMKTVPQMAAEYNEKAIALGLKPVKKFRDRATGERRLAELAERPTSMNMTASVTAEKPKAGKLSPEARAAIVADFKFRSPAREKLLNFFLDRFETQITKTELGDLAEYIVGIEWRIDNRKIKYQVKVDVTKDGKKEVTYGLYRVHAK